MKLDSKVKLVQTDKHLSKVDFNLSTIELSRRLKAQIPTQFERDEKKNKMNLVK